MGLDWQDLALWHAALEKQRKAEGVFACWLLLLARGLPKTQMVVSAAAAGVAETGGEWEGPAADHDVDGGAEEGWACDSASCPALAVAGDLRTQYVNMLN